MNREKQIERFISESIKQGVPIFDDIRLLNLLQQMETKEVQMFWIHYSASRAFSQANVHVPDWKTKEQEQYFKELSSSLLFYPKEKDTDGKYIIDRNDLIDHVRKHLENIINQDIQSNKAFKRKTFLEKLTTYILASTLIIIPFFIVSSLFSYNPICKVILIACYVMYGLNLLLYPLVTFIIRRRHSKIIV